MNGDIQYKIGDIIEPKYIRHREWGSRIIAGYDAGIGYLWKYLGVDDKIFSSLNSCDPMLNIYWKRIKM